jgi:hypothetical protein
MRHLARPTHVVASTTLRANGRREEAVMRRMTMLGVIALVAGIPVCSVPGHAEGPA